MWWLIYHKKILNTSHAWYNDVRCVYEGFQVEIELNRRDCVIIGGAEDLISMKCSATMACNQIACFGMRCLVLLNDWGDWRAWYYTHKNFQLLRGNQANLKARIDVIMMSAYATNCNLILNFSHLFCYVPKNFYGWIKHLNKVPDFCRYT